MDMLSFVIAVVNGTGEAMEKIFEWIHCDRCGANHSDFFEFGCWSHGYTVVCKECGKTVYWET